MTRPTLTIGELAEAAGLTRRAVRFYVQRGLLPPPEGAGRGAHYEARHLDQLRSLQELQQRGYALEEIRRILEGQIVEERGGSRTIPAGGCEPIADGDAAPGGPQGPGPDRDGGAAPPYPSLGGAPSTGKPATDGGPSTLGAPHAWLRVTLGPGVELHFDPSRAALGAADLRALARALDERLGGNPAAPARSAGIDP